MLRGDLMGRKSKGDVCLRVADALCSTVETHNIVKQPYSNKMVLKDTAVAGKPLLPTQLPFTERAHPPLSQVSVAGNSSQVLPSRKNSLQPQGASSPRRACTSARGAGKWAAHSLCRLTRGSRGASPLASPWDQWPCPEPPGGLN